jgi:carbon-monoxide dehydrogenase medium subunit
MGGNICNAGPANDSAPVLIAMGATLRIGSKNGTREIPVEQFFAGPSRSTLEPNELLVQIRIPAQPANSGAAYLRFIPRNEMDIAVCSSGVRLVLSADGSRIESARVAIGASAPTPLFVEAAGAALAGQPANNQSFTRAGEACSQAVSPIDDMRGGIAQRRHLAKVLTVRALETALKRAQEAR